MENGTCEIIQVLSDGFLISSTWSTCRYATQDRQPLEPGFYFVLWPPGASLRGDDPHARYFGPFLTKVLAEKLKASAARLGIIGPKSSVSRTKAEEGMMRYRPLRRPEQANSSPRGSITIGGGDASDDRSIVKPEAPRNFIMGDTGPGLPKRDNPTHHVSELIDIDLYG